MAPTPETSTEEAELLLRARAGDTEAIERLYVLHVEPARRLASVLAGPVEGEELLADAFARVIAQLRLGRGPSLNFRAYLFTTIRNRFNDSSRVAGRERPVSDQPWVLEENQPPVPAPDLATDAFDASEAIAAFSSLPDSWQEVLWHIEVEGRRVQEVAELLRTTPQAVSSLAYRAREGLRLAYLNRRLPGVPLDGSTARECRWTRDRLGQYVRGGLSARAVAKTDAHLAVCSGCAAACAELTRTNNKLAALLLPVVLIGGGARFAGAGPGPGAGAGAGSTAAGTAGTTTGMGARAAAFINGPATVVAAVTTAALGAAAAVGWWATSDPAADVPRSAAPIPAPTQTTGSGRGPTLQGWASDLVVPLTDFVVPTPEPVVAVPGEPVAVEQPPVVAEPPPRNPAPAGPAESPTRQAFTDRPPDKPKPEPAPDPKPPVAVTPVAPTATTIQGCGDYGDVALPTTTGLTYTLTQGDGQQGPWTVTAAAQPGYVVAAGAPSTFSGDLGTFYPCPTIASTLRVLVDPADDRWDVTVDVDTAGQASYLISVELRFDDVVFTRGDHGAGWNCWATDGGTRVELPVGHPSGVMLQPGAQWIVCEFAYTGSDPGPIRVPVSSPSATLSGTASVRAEGAVRDSLPF